MKRKRLILTCLVPMVFIAIMIGCAPNYQEASPTNDDASNEASAAALNWTSSSDCSTCHTAEESSLSDAACLASVHQAQENLSCADCHDDTDALSEVHSSLTTADTQGALRLKATTVDNCLDCHVQDEIMAVTATSTTLTDSQGTVVNPHQLPVNEGHAEFGTACIECHSMHEPDSVPAAEAKDFCASCHHMGVYSCYTCHE